MLYVGFLRLKKCICEECGYHLQMNSTKNFAMAESLTEQCEVEVEGPQVVNSFFQKKMNDNI